MPSSTALPKVAFLPKPVPLEIQEKTFRSRCHDTKRSKYAALDNLCGK